MGDTYGLQKTGHRSPVDVSDRQVLLLGTLLLIYLHLLLVLVVSLPSRVDKEDMAR